MQISYNNYIKECFNICLSKIKSGENFFITGRNMSGKSDIIKMILDSDIMEEIYFIDTVNRNIIQDEREEIVFQIDDAIKNPLEIIKVRRLEKNFNTIDCFGSGEENLGSIYAYYLLKSLYTKSEFKKKLQIFFEELPVKILKNESSKQLKFLFDECEIKLSSGYQALLRIFTEIFYIKYFYNIKIFIIDEIDVHLDTVMCREIVKKLKEVFPDIQIISTVHSVNFFQENLTDNILVLKGESRTFKIINASELGSLENTIKIIFEDEKKVDFDTHFQKKIISELKNKTFLNKLDRVYLKKMNEKIEKTESDEQFLNFLKDFDYYITFETIRNKIFNKESLNELDAEFIKFAIDRTPDEDSLKNIMLKLGKI